MPVPEHVRPLFWDTNADALDPRAHPDYVIERILEHGDQPDVDWLRQAFSEDQIRTVQRTTRRLSPRSANFWALVFQVAPQDVPSLRNVRPPGRHADSGVAVPSDRHEWYPGVLPPGWSTAARRLAERSVQGGFYLAGGTGLALRRGHRRSVDLDLFTEAPFAATSVRDRLRDVEGLSHLEVGEGTVHLMLDAVKVSFLHYPYPLLFPPGMFGGP
jgi:hypothetical protein